MDVIYLDYNASTPLDKEVADFMIPFLTEKFGNPSSMHFYGIEAKKEMELARYRLSQLLNCKTNELIFTSGGTESNNLALKGVAYALKNKGKHIITSKIEHPSILEVCKNLENEGFEISYLDVDEKGRINPEDVKRNIKSDTILVSIMHANNEVGTIQDIQKISQILKEKSILFHSDAAQSIGKVETDVKKLGVDLLSIAGHKFYGPKGIGALYIRQGIKLVKQMHGANHEQDIRPGTENILEIAGIGKAAEVAFRDFEKNTAVMKKTRDLLYKLIKKEIPLAVRNGAPTNCLPNTLSISFPGLDVSLLFSEMIEIAASAGAACHTEETTISHVLEAMHLPFENAFGTLRLSTGKNTSEQEIEKAAEILCGKIKQLISPHEQQNVSNLSSQKIKLTQFTHGMGCACKLSPRILEEILKDLTPAKHPDILIGSETSDDASVYRINDETAIVQSVDFFTPVVDDPYSFGAIAASNAISDIYAMGATPLFGLNIVAFPHQRLPIQVLKDILAGAESVCNEAGISILGGHTIEDNEPKFGMVITGTIHPKKIISNKGAKEGDDLILTKKIGTGILSTAFKRGLLNDESAKELYNNMRSLNNISSQIMLKYNPSACTDVTGFGLAGHLKEMCQASGTGAEIHYGKIHLLPQVEEYASQNIIPGGTINNRNYLEDYLIWEDQIVDIQKNIICDAQTSGGLLIALNTKHSSEFLKELDKAGITANIIGSINNNKDKISVKC